MVFAKSAAGWLPISASCLATVGVFLMHGLAMRLVLFICTLLWLVNNALSGSIGGTVLEALMASTASHARPLYVMLHIMKPVAFIGERDPTTVGRDEKAALVYLLETYRARCLWFLRPDFVPASKEEWLRTLDLIERYGDMAAFKQAEEARKWLSHPSKVAF